MLASPSASNPKTLSIATPIRAEKRPRRRLPAGARNADHDLRADGMDFALDRGDLLERVAHGADVQGHRVEWSVQAAHRRKTAGLAPRSIVRGAGDAHD